MDPERINRTEIMILRAVLGQRATISMIATSIGKSLSYTSECIDHLRALELIAVDDRGLSHFVTVSMNSLGERLALLMTEHAHLNFDRILSGPGLLFLPLLLPPGMKRIEIARRTHRSTRTVRDALNRWKGMGVAVHDTETKRFMLNPNQHYLIAFVAEYSTYHNRRMLRELFPEALIVWQDRDEFIFSIPYPIDHPNFRPAASSRLAELNYDVIATSNYYLYDPQTAGISEAEALVQTIRLHPENPRPFRFIREAIQNNRVNPADIVPLAEKYGVTNLFPIIVQGAE